MPWMGEVVVSEQLEALAAWARAVLDRVHWWLARGAVDAVRYSPRHLDLVLVCGASQPEVPAPVTRWLADVRTLPAVVQVSRLPHATVRLVAGFVARVLGPTASVLVRWLSGAAAGAADRAGAVTIERQLRGRVHPGLLVPHPHAVAVLAADMRGFSGLTSALDDTQYLADLLEEYLTALTRVIEDDRGLVFQYTGDGLLALFLPELAGVADAAMLDGIVRRTTPELHGVFDTMHARWEAEWHARGRVGSRIGLGIGLSFGRATIGFLGPSGKKQFGVIGEPVNVATLLCAEARTGTVLVEHASFGRAGVMPPAAKVVRLRSKKRRQRIEALCLHPGG